LSCLIIRSTIIESMNKSPDSVRIGVLGCGMISQAAHHARLYAICDAAWYCDSTSRYTETANVQPLVIKSTKAKRPEKNDLVLAFEPESENVVNSATRARDLLNELQKPRLRVVIDPANLIGPRDFLRRGLAH
jgi:hypothetical protein